ncbi:hypothetical protein C0J52_00473 [Blattella germanica]|nr:hypothetical protein C0J52_00473 [Blattella germanica]
MKPRRRAMVNAIWKREFSPKSILLDYNKPEQFVRCQWQKRLRVHLVYLTYRWFLAILFVATMIFSIFDPGRGSKNSGLRYISKWPIYLTNWGYTVCTIQAVLGAWILTRRVIAERKPGFSINGSDMPLSYKVYWALHTTGIVMAIGITIAYWLTVYDPSIHSLDTLNLMVHAFNSVFMVTDLFLVAHPFRLLHCYWPFLVTVCYVVFSYIYYESGGTDRHERAFVYPLLDWRQGKRTAASSVFGLVFVLTVHCIAWFLFLIRKWISLLVKKKPALTYEEKSNHTTVELQPALHGDEVIC